MKYIIFCDLDDTLIKKHKYYVSQENINAIKSFVNDENHFVISTGRWIDRITPLLEQINNSDNKLINYVISLAGAYIYDTKNHNVIYAKTIEDDVYVQLEQIINKYKIMSIVYSKESFQIRKAFGYYVGWENWFLKVSDNWSLQKIKANKQLTGVFKVLIPFLTKKKCDKILRLLDSLKDKIKIIPQKYYIEILQKDVNKGSAVQFLMQYLDLDKNNICSVSIGDSMNDLDMFNVTDRRYIVNPNAGASPLNFMNLPVIENHDYLAVSKIINALNKEKK